ncbi:MAG TPA: HD domain-containing protein [Armatimonadota bacterium]|nr:HD domain-containing protein [Armatimonadota bacterium]
MKFRMFRPVIKDNTIIEDILRRALCSTRDGRLYVVGGCLRDWALGQPPKDVDLAVEDAAPTVARHIAKGLDGHSFLLHEATQTARVALPSGLWIDIVQAPDGLEQDLRARDFTINAMAAPAEDYLARLSNGRHAPVKGKRPQWIVDPLDGWGDLKNRKLRLCHPDSVNADPLRVLRAVRLITALDLGVDDETDIRLRLAVPRLEETAAERVRDEWLSGLDRRDGYRYLVEAARRGVLDVILPEWRDSEGLVQNGYHHLDVWEHTVEVLRLLGALEPPKDLEPLVTTYLDELFTGLHTRRGLLYTAAVLHDIGKPTARTEDENGIARFHGHDRVSAEQSRAWLARWKFSQREKTFVSNVIRLHMRAGSVVGRDATPKAIYRFFRDAGDAAPALLLLNIADRLSARGPWTSDEEVRDQVDGSWRMLGRWSELLTEANLPLPLSGRDVMREFAMPPGPEVGRVLSAVRDLHDDTPFANREAALEAARNVVNDRIPETDLNNGTATADNNVQ